MSAPCIERETTDAPPQTRTRRRSLRDWLDDRTGYRRGLKLLFGRELPDGPKWGYTIASSLLWLMVVQVATGFLLMTTYSPSLATAWASVHFIEQDAAGAFLRGVHHFAAQAMIVLFLVHLVRVLLTAAFRAPRELVWITGLLLIPLVLVWAITGNPLPGSQRGMSQIDVEGNIVGTTPVIGPVLQRVLIGGDHVGNLTLTHLYFLHVALLPMIAVLLLGVHVWQVYRHGLSGASLKGRVSGARVSRPVPYWPHQTARNMIVLSVVLGTVAFLAWRVGAPLEVPADPEIAHSPRPEWYFLSLFELRRYFNGPWEVVATLVIPLALLLFLVCLPRIDAACSRRIGTVLRVGVVLLFCGGWGWLTLASVLRDRDDAECQKSEAHLAQLSARARELADGQGVPVEGAVALLRNDPKTQGPRLFSRHCANCHSHADAEGNGIIAAEPSAPNLYGFAGRLWIAGLLDPHRIAGPDYFGRTKAAEGDMAGTVRDAFASAATAKERAKLSAEMDAIAAALAAEANSSTQAEPDDASKARMAEGRRLIAERCTDCHKFHDQGELGSAPDLTGYGSRDWLRGMIADPNQDRFYGDGRNDRMPAFHGKPHDSSGNLLTDRELDLLIGWLRQAWYRRE